MRVAAVLVALFVSHGASAETIALTGSVDIARGAATAQLAGAPHALSVEGAVDLSMLFGLNPVPCIPDHTVFGNTVMEFHTFGIDGVGYDPVRDTFGEWVNVVTLRLVTDPIVVPAFNQRLAAVTVPFLVDGRVSHRGAFAVDREGFSYELAGTGAVTMRFTPQANLEQWTFAGADFQLTPVAIPEPSTWLLLASGILCTPRKRLEYR